MDNLEKVKLMCKLVFKIRVLVPVLRVPSYLPTLSKF